MIRRSSTRITSGRCIMAERPASGKPVNLRLLRMREIERLVKARFGQVLPSTVDAEPYLRGIAYAANAGSEGDQLHAALTAWMARWAPHLAAASDTIVEPVRLRVQGRRHNLNPTEAGVLVCLTWAERQALKVKTMWAADLPIDEQRRRRAEQKKRDDADRQRRAPRKAGSLPRAEWSSNTVTKAAERPWEALGKSRSWWFDQQRRAKLDSSVAVRAEVDWTRPSQLARNGLFPNDGGGGFLSFLLPKVNGARAKGGPVPELFTPGRSGGLTPNDMLSGPPPAARMPRRQVASVSNHRTFNIDARGAQQGVGAERRHDRTHYDPRSHRRGERAAGGRHGDRDDLCRGAGQRERHRGPDLCPHDASSRGRPVAAAGRSGGEVVIRMLLALAVMILARWAITALSPVRGARQRGAPFACHRTGLCLALYRLRNRARAWGDLC